MGGYYTCYNAERPETGGHLAQIFRRALQWIQPSPVKCDTVTWGTSVYRSHFTETVNIAAAALNGRNYNCRRAWKKIDATKVTVSCGAWCNSSAAVVAWLYTVLMRRLRLALLRWSNDFPRRIGLSARNSKITTRKSANWRRCSKLCLFFSPNVGLHYAEKM